jgi:hypothetical protein
MTVSGLRVGTATGMRRTGSDAGHPVISNATRCALSGVLVALCLVGVATLVHPASQLFQLEEAGYGDSYILYDVVQFQRTGYIYRDLSVPPYLPAQYSPLLYLLLSVPGRFASWESPFVGPRLVVLAAFAMCVTRLASIVRTIIPGRFVWMWAILLAASISVM